MVSVTELQDYCDRLLGPERFDDHCPNGLQVAGERPIRHLISGVTASLALIEAAAAREADAILVHPGWLWKGESPRLLGIKGRRVRTILRSGMSLLAYHLPLDAHPEIGNNRSLGEQLGLQALEATSAGGGLIWKGLLATPLPGRELAHHIGTRLDRIPLHIAVQEEPIASIAWCTGAAQHLIEEAAALGVQAYLSGEISEQTVHQARELGLDYFAAGHHATERYGVQRLGDRIAAAFGIQHRFLDLDNPA